MNVEKQYRDNIEGFKKLILKYGLIEILRDYVIKKKTIVKFINIIEERKMSKRIKESCNEIELYCSALIYEAIYNEKGMDNRLDALPKIEKDSSIATNIFLIKIPSYGINIITPDWLIYLIEMCADGIPGYIQLIYKEILKSINDKIFNNNGIPNDYTITTTDVINCFPSGFPIIMNPDIEKEYSKLWDAQKKTDRDSVLESDNMCDTAEYWLEVVAK